MITQLDDRPITKRLSLLCITLAWLTTIVPVLSPAAPPIIPAAPQIVAKSHILMDFNSGYVIHENNSTAAMEPASLTKLMTAYVVFAEIRSGNIKLDDQVHVSEKAWRMPGSRTFIEVGKRVSVEDLLLGMIVQSGNDATVALAEHIAGSEEVFAEVMNQRAKALGMLNSHFVNSTGLPHPDHYTTARDMALLARAVIAEYPEYYKWYSVKEFTYNGIKQFNRNKLLWRDDSVDGVKTGHTESAGYCLIASAKRDNMRLISVVLGAKSTNGRAEESQKLLNFGFRFYETHRLYAANEALTTVRVWKGAKDELPMGVASPLYVTIPRGQYKNLEAAVKVPDIITAPLTAGQELGTVTISLAGSSLAERPLVALADIAEGGLIEQLFDEVLLMFK